MSLFSESIVYLNNIIFLSNLFICLIFLSFLFIIFFYKNKLIYNYIINLYYNFNKLMNKNLILSYESNLFTKNYIKQIRYSIYILIWVCFILILLLNLLSLVTYNFSFTTHISFNIFLSTLICLYALILGIWNYKTFFFCRFVPLNCPNSLAPVLILAESLSFLSRFVSLGLRLTVNVTCGHILISLISVIGFKIISIISFWPIFFILLFILLIFIMFLEVVVSIIQAYIFTVLSIIYIGESTEFH